MAMLTSVFTILPAGAFSHEVSPIFSFSASARFDESPTAKLMVNGVYVKEYWGEGSNRARNWQRYDLGGKAGLSFEEGVDSYVTYAGPLHDNLEMSVYKIKSTMCNCGVTNLEDLKRNARLTLVSSVSIVEGGSHDVILKNK